MIFDRKVFATALERYYQQHYGQSSTDVWYEQPAVNVSVFEREGKIITLKCHILTDQVTEQTEEARQ